jgi:hypothetical protein
MNLRGIKFAVLRKFGVFVGLSILPLMLLLVLAMIFLGRFLVDRTFIVDARTTGLELQFVGSGNVWSFQRALVCEFRPAVLDPSLTSTPTNSGACGSPFYQASEVDGLILSWAADSTISVRMDQGSDLEIILESGTEYPNGTIIKVKRSAWRTSGALAFSGMAQVGQAMSNGQRSFLLSGRYEARERSVFGALFGRATDTVKSGTLNRGDQVTIVEQGEVITSYGHVTLPDDNADVGFNVVAISRPGNTALQYTYFGASEPVEIRPDWIDSAISSPFLLAFTIILSVLASAAQLFGSSVEYLLKRRSNNQLDHPSRSGSV